ncbi:nucleotide exchange factor GrpE [bacterium]|nr:nucleotide exchange factor GrpE [bacterium]
MKKKAGKTRESATADGAGRKDGNRKSARVREKDVVEGAESIGAAAEADAGAATGSPADERIAGLEAELADVNDRMLRTLAEFDNFRRRSMREREDAGSRGSADVVRELLDVADNFDRALEHAGDDVPKSFLEGMDMVARGLHDLLDRKGVARMDAEGKPFDPELHDALTRAPAENVAPNTVLQVVQPGYLLHDRVLRPAKVIVAAPPAPVDATPVDAPASEDGGEDA